VGVQDVKTIALRRPDRCIACETKLAVGERACWDRARRTITCLACAARIAEHEHSAAAAAVPEAPAALEPGVAGASAKREYQRRRDARAQHARQQLGTLGVVLVRAGGDPRTTRVWKQGAEGEEKLAKRLAELLEGKGVHLLHDRRVPGKQRANIDHIAIGPGGITVIDAKTLHGQIRVQSVGGLFSPRRKQLRVAGRDRTALVRGVQAQADALRSLLASIRKTEVEVRCALCFIGVDGLPMFRRLEIEGTIIDGPEQVAKLAARPGPLEAAEVEDLTARLASMLPAA
jgi:hypothetical protein